ncbi:hypothetical protein B0H14DRAFT_3433492 [Mycena olivaceomarginata]|nr:hypothetical protein B0H14DRAFT_3433492 [Mycena olivaceomarginata]
MKEDGAADASHLPIICPIFLCPNSHPGLVRRCPSLTPSTHSATTVQHALRATYPCNTDSSLRRGLLSTATRGQRKTEARAQYTAPFPDIRPALWPRLSFSGFRIRLLRHTSWKTQLRPTTARPRYSHRSRLPIRLVCARVGHVCPTVLPFLSSLHVLKPSSSPYLPLPFSISTLTCSCPPLVTKPPRNHLPSRKLPVPRCFAVPIDERDIRRVLHPALTLSRIPLRAHEPSGPSVPPPPLFRIRRYTRSRYADSHASPVPCSFLAFSDSTNNPAASGSIHATAARHASALRSANSMPCFSVLSLSPSLSPWLSSPPPLYLLALPHLCPHSLRPSPFPISLPPPSLASMRQSINAAARSI